VLALSTYSGWQHLCYDKNPTKSKVQIVAQGFKDKKPPLIFQAYEPP